MYTENAPNSVKGFKLDSLLHDLLQNRADNYPDRIALQFNEQEITFKNLHDQSNRLAHYLIGKGVGVGDFIGVCLPRSVELLVSLLAVMKSGAAYVPMDANYPQDRLDFILKDSDAKYVLTSGGIFDSSYARDKSLIMEDVAKTLEGFPNAQPKTKVTSEDNAYLIYTSGSTGKPKGVALTHKNLVSSLQSIAMEPGLDENDRVLAITTISFDIAAVELFLPLLQGACIVLLDEETILDARQIVKCLEEENISMVQATPTKWQMFLDAGWDTPLKLKAFCGGEQLSPSLADKLLERCSELWNMYGPSEACINSCIKQIVANEEPISIGKPIANTTIYLLNEKNEAVDVNEEGEIVIGGLGVAKGYWKRPDLTSQKFISLDLDGKGESHFYKTGDLARKLNSEDIQFIGRIDQQVKIRGHRVELGEIESTITKNESVNAAAVIEQDGHLIAFLVPKTSLNGSQYEDIRSMLKSSLPNYMVPQEFRILDKLPMTTNGKVDRKKLPTLPYKNIDIKKVFKGPQTGLQKILATIWSNTLEIEQISIDENFFEIGGTSITAQKTANLIEKEIETDIKVTKLYQFPTIEKFAAHISESKSSKTKSSPHKQREESNSSRDVAIIGMAGRFPGASTIDELWEVLKNGEETISFFSPEELDESISESLRSNPNYVKARGIVPSAKEFDAAFFGLNHRLAEVMDPQHRLFLEISWEVLEKTGHLPSHYDGTIGVYGGVGVNTYFRNNILPNHELRERIGNIQVNTANEKDYIATRTAYHLNLTGPAVSVHSACSTSLLAVAEAVGAIRNGQCDAAIAGASSVTAPMNSGHLYDEGSILSPDGHCRSFDADGKGTLFSDGACVVLLKDLKAAKEDGDTIYGVIKGVGVNNDGSNKGSFTAPNAEQQADAIRKALEDAKIPASSISYIEAHGTATPVGDPIEMEGLNMAFGAQEKREYCAIGSIKSNMGHLTAAAGAAGLIKTVLALYHKQLPPSIGYEKPNPLIDFKSSPFFVNAELNKWKSSDVRRAGVSSFGMGGTNVHVVVEEYDAKIQEEIPQERPLHLIPWSAKTTDSLDAYDNRLKDYLQSNTKVSLADVAFSLTGTREDFQNRRFFVAKERDDAIDILKEKSKHLKTKILDSFPNDVVFLFPGQGSQYLKMGKELYDNETVFRSSVDRCSEILLADFQYDIREIIFTEKPENSPRLSDTRFTQPALFVIEYAMAQLWMHWGIQPTVVCGHSIGEFVAAHLAGIFSLEDALHLIAERGRLVSELPGGSMLSVRATQSRLKELLPEGLSIAAVNAEKLCVISGLDNEIDDFAKELKSQSIPCAKLNTSHAFHSAMMELVLDSFREEVEKVEMNVPTLKIISTVTGNSLEASEATSAVYWTNHLRETVQFANAAKTIIDIGSPLMLEVGPGNTLMTLVKQTREGRALTCVQSLPKPNSNESDYEVVLDSLGTLWLNGLKPDWKSFYAGENRSRLELPSYAFDRKPCWIKPLGFEAQNQKTAIITESPVVENNNTNEGQTEPKKSRKSVLQEKISDIIVDISGIEIEVSDAESSFIELGLDSLILTQLAMTCKKEFELPITFRQLNESLNTPERLIDYLDENLPADVLAPANQTLSSLGQTRASINSGAQGNDNEKASLNLISQQLQLLAKQVEQLQGGQQNPKLGAKEKSSRATNIEVTAKTAKADVLTEEEKKIHEKPFGASPKIERNKAELTKIQKAFVKDLIRKYNQKTQKSKDYTQRHRAHMADPRVVSGFKPNTKELVYPLVIEKSSGNQLWDLDGNEYLDVLNGFGSCLFGHQPDFIKRALSEQIESGYEVGPQHPLAGEVSELLCEFTGHDRAALCNTGSEAVLGAMRIARTITGRSLIVAFTGSYHGINDEGLVRGSKRLKTFPAAAGIMPETVQNILVLDYGTEESLKIIKERAKDLAGVLVEPVQGRRPEFRPFEFLKEVREITEESGTALIFDEVITGFRTHPGGIQKLIGVQADIATYGKVIGGGLSVGAILGKKKFMDALDGGHWQYGDESFPEVGVTYFAGTFVRHPLALAAAKASLEHMKKQGPNLQERLNNMAGTMVSELNADFKRRNLPIEINNFSSWWRLKFTEEIPYSELLFVLLRQKGIHIWDGFPCFFTEAFTDEDVNKIKNAITESLNELISAGFFKTGYEGKKSTDTPALSDDINKPPRENASLRLDEHGNPAWFIQDEKNSGEFIKIAL